MRNNYTSHLLREVFGDDEGGILKGSYLLDLLALRARDEVIRVFCGVEPDGDRLYLMDAEFKAEVDSTVEVLVRTVFEGSDTILEALREMDAVGDPTE